MKQRLLKKHVLATMAQSLLCAMLSRAMRGVRPYWRDRLMWLSTPDASLILLTGAATIVMAISLVLTLSLSGMTALAAAIAITAVCVIRRRWTRGRTLRQLRGRPVRCAGVRCDAVRGRRRGRGVRVHAAGRGSLAQRRQRVGREVRGLADGHEPANFVIHSVLDFLLDQRKRALRRNQIRKSAACAQHGLPSSAPIYLRSDTASSIG